MDKRDRRILHELEADARIPTKQLAKKLRISQQSASYRLSALEKKGIIGGYYTLIDIRRLRHTNYRTMIRLSNLHTDTYKKIVAHLCSHGNVLWLVECGGRWDLIVNIAAKDINHYSKILRHIKNAYPDNIQNHQTLTSVNVTYFGRDYFLGERQKVRTQMIGNSNKKSRSIDKLDKKILSQLSEHGRASALSIAQKVDASANTVIRRIKSLEDDDVILGYKPLIHLENTAFSEYKILIRFHNITEDKENELHSHLKQYPNVVGIITLVGAWDFEIEIAAQDRKEIRQFTRSLRDEFSSIVQEVEVVPLFREHKYSFFVESMQ